MDILIVDDDPIGVYLAERIIKSEGLFSTVTSFQSPIEALAYLRQQIPDGRLPQVILLDLNMPLIYGWDILEALKPHSAQLQSKSSIYLLTSSFAVADLARAQEHPLIEALIRKPLDSLKIQEIYEQVRRIRPDLPADSG